MTIWAWLLAAVGPLAVKVLVALGFTAVAFTGVQVLVSQLVQLAQANWSAMPFAVLQLAALSGVPQALGMICAAYTARVAFWVASNGTKYVLQK